jgi:hypothetical protein
LHVSQHYIKRENDLHKHQLTWFEVLPSSPTNSLPDDRLLPKLQSKPFVMHRYKHGTHPAFTNSG